MKRKLMALLMAMALCVSMLAGCGAGETDVTTEAPETKEQNNATEGNKEETSAEVAEEPVKLKIWVQEKVRVEDWETNAMTLWLEEHGNLDLEFEILPAADYATKVSVALTVGDIEDLPDVILGSFSSTQVWEYAQAETILPLTEYYENPEVAVNIDEAIERCNFDYTQQIVSPDGNIYGIASYNQSYGNEYPYKMWIYKPWLDALGEDIPTTTEEYYQLLKKVSETDLNGNGKKDEIGLAGDKSTYDGYFEWLMNAFVYSGGDGYRVIEDGVVSAAYTTDEWKEGLKYIHKMFDEGLILSESQTMEVEQFKTLLNAETQTVFSYVYYNAEDSVRANDYVVLDTLTGPEGVNFATFVPTSASVKMLVTANCDNPEAAFRLGDLMCGEYMSITTRWGQEGVDWDYAENLEDASAYVPNVDGSELSICAYDDSTFWSGADAQNRSWLQVGPYVRHYAIANGSAKNADTLTQVKENSNAGATLYQTSGHQPDQVANVLVHTTEEAEIIADVGTGLTNYVDESTAAFLSGNLDIETAWDDFVNEVNKIGLESWLEVIQAAYDRAYK